MAAPQGLFHWPGVQHKDSGTFTLSHGIAPSVCNFSILPQPARTIAEHGTLTISYGRDSWQFPECRVTYADVQGGISESLRIEDRRWKWRFGSIYGHYNTRLKNGEIDRNTEKTPQELATLLFRAMGEQRFDVAALPNVDRPQVDWDFDNPAVELQRLVENRSCRIVPDYLRNRFAIARTGQGAKLPTGGRVDDSYGINAPGVPDSLLCIGGPVRFQSALKLEAVAKEPDGEVVPLTNASYILDEDEAGGLGKSGSEFPNITDKDDRAAAEESVFKWYRVVSQIDGSQNVPGFNNANLKIKNLLPLATVQAETYKDKDGIERPKQAIVYGTFWAGGYSLENVEDTLFKGSFSIEGETGIVKFSEQVKKITGDSSDFSFLPAELYLVTSYNVTVDGQVTRFGRERQLGGRRGTGPRVLKRPEIDRKVIGTYSGFSARNHSSITDNLADVNREANHYLDAAQLEYQIGETEVLTYPGLYKIPLDGAIQQITWSFGGSGAYTRASRNSEADLDVPDYKTRQEIEKRRRDDGGGK